MGRIIALVSSGAGTGRTTTAAHVSMLLALGGNRTLLADFGPGWPALQLLGVDPSVDPSVDAEWYAHPRRSDLAGSGFSPVTSPDTALQHAARLRNWRDTWDLIVLDLPPLTEQLDPLLATADEVVILTSSARKDTLANAARTISALMPVQGTLNPNMRVAGILMTMADRRLQQFERQMLRATRSFPVNVFPFCIPWDAHLANSGESIENMATGRGARGYVELTMELLSDG